MIYAYILPTFIYMLKVRKAEMAYTLASLLMDLFMIEYDEQINFNRTENKIKTFPYLHKAQK